MEHLTGPVAYAENKIKTTVSDKVNYRGAQS